MLSEDEFNRVMDYITNPRENSKRDKFSYKLGFAVCNEFYANKTGLKDLSPTK